MSITLQSYSMSLGESKTFDVVLIPSQNIANWIIQVVINRTEIGVKPQDQRWDHGHGLNDWHWDRDINDQCCGAGSDASAWQPINLATTTGTVMITDANRGVFTFTIAESLLNCLKPGILFWQARRLVGDVGTTLAEGYITVTATPVFPPCPPSLDQQFFVADSGVGNDSLPMVAVSLSYSDIAFGGDFVFGGPIPPVVSSSSSSSSSGPSFPGIRQFATQDLTQGTTIRWPVPTLAGSDLVVIIQSANGATPPIDFAWQAVDGDNANYNAAIDLFYLLFAASQSSTTGWVGYSAVAIEVRGGSGILGASNAEHGRGTNVFCNGLVPVNNNLIIAAFAIINPDITAISGQYSEVVAFGGMVVLARLSGTSETPYAFVTNLTTEFWGSVIATWS